MLCNCFRRFISFHSQVANLTSIPRPLASPSLPLPVSCSPPPSMAPSWPLPSIPQTLQCPSRRVACPKLTGNFCFRWELARVQLLIIIEIVETNLFFIASESFVRLDQVSYRAPVLPSSLNLVRCRGRSTSCLQMLQFRSPLREWTLSWMVDAPRCVQYSSVVMLTRESQLQWKLTAIGIFPLSMPCYCTCMIPWICTLLMLVPVVVRTWR